MLMACNLYATANGVPVRLGSRSGWTPLVLLADIMISEEITQIATVKRKIAEYGMNVFPYVLVNRSYMLKQVDDTYDTWEPVYTLPNELKGICEKFQILWPRTLLTLEDHGSR